MNQQEAFSKMATMCSRREYCKADVLAKLNLLQVSELHQKAIVDDLVNLRFVNEERFALAFVRDKFRFSHWGRAKIKQALHLRKVEKEATRVALEQIDDDEYFNVIRDLIQSKSKQIKSKTPYEHKTKLIRFLLQRGFEYDDVREVLGQPEEDLNVE